MPEDHAAATRIAELERDNQRLRRLLDQRDAPGELRHRLRGFVAMLRVMIRRSAATERDLEAYVGHLEDRLDALVRAQAVADERGSLDFHGLIADELLRYGAAEGQRLLLSGPDVELCPRAGQVLALAIHELAVNAIEHGALGAGTGQVEVAWSVGEDGADAPLTFTWKERGSTDAAERPGPGFGTEVLTHMLHYELKAVTTLDFEADGLRCTIRFPLQERIGRVVTRQVLPE